MRRRQFMQFLGLSPLVPGLLVSRKRSGTRRATKEEIEDFHKEWKEQEYLVRYDIDTKTQYTIEDGKIMDIVTFDYCPYIWYGKIKDDIDSGLIKCVAWKRVRLV